MQAYRPLHQHLYAFCRALCGNEADAADLLQDTALNTMQNMHRLKDPGAFRAFVFSIARNLYKMKMRRKKFKVEYSPKEAESITGSTNDPELLTDFSIVYETMQKLPQRTAEALILFHISDVSLKDIQKIQGGSLSGVKLRLKRGREKLMTLLSTPEHSKILVLFSITF